MAFHEPPEEDRPARSWWATLEGFGWIVVAISLTAVIYFVLNLVFHWTR